MKLPVDDQLTLQALREQIADSDSEWWPFVFLRPQPHEHFTITRCASLALLYGMPAALAAVVGGKWMGEALEPLHLALFPLSVSALAFVLLRVGVVSFWNQRAARLRPLHERRTQWRRSLRDKN